MQNTYYLPPAHSKPFVDPCPSTDSSKKSPLKAASPTFFDIFKFGKKQSSGSEQKPTIAPSGPMLRTTSDTSTFSGFLSPQPSKYPKQQLSVPGIPTMRPEPKKGRVVVVRERMEDLELVARQVEEDLKIREAERRRNASISSQSEVLQDDLVDPTDCVDLPPAPSNIFFGPQASILNGMGVETSVGAALLADQLPPSSPAMWSTDSDDMAWRKALLHAAVDHSMNNTPVATPSRSRSNSSPFLSLDAAASSPPPVPPLSPTLLHLSAKKSQDNGNSESPVPNTGSPYPLLRKKRILGQRILTQMIDEELDMSSPSNEFIADNDGRLPNITEKSLSLNILPNAGHEPVRASSPTIPTTPLLPPPRRQNAMSMLSCDGVMDNFPLQECEKAPDHLQVIRPDSTQARLSDEYGTQNEPSGIISDPSLPISYHGSQHNSATLSAVNPEAGKSPLKVPESITSGSHYSDDDQETSVFHTPREHTLASTHTLSRPSLNSLHSCVSSYTSASHNLNHESSASNSVVNTLGNNSRSPSRSSDVEVRCATVSPPPRVSSSLAYSSLSPAPRPRITTTPMPTINISGGQTYTVDEEEPGTPTGPTSNQLSSLYPPNPASASSSYPTSPISFFDAVEEQNNKDDDGNFLCFDDDDDEDEDGDEDIVEDHESVVGSIDSNHHSDSARSMAGGLRSGSSFDVSRVSPVSFTQHRNTSSPQLSHGSKVELGTGLGYDAKDRRAIGNSSQMASLGKSWYTKPEKQREHQAIGLPRLSESIADRVKHEVAKRDLLGDKNRPRTTGSNAEQGAWANQGAGSSSVQTWRDEQNRQDQSMRRLDGLLIQHMEREREVLKRITTTLSKSSST